MQQQRPSSQLHQQNEEVTAKKQQKLMQKPSKRREHAGQDSVSQEGKVSDGSLSKSMSSKLNQATRAAGKNTKQQNQTEDVPKKVVLDVASAALPTGRRLAETATMGGIVSRVYEDEHHYHMVFKNCSSTKGNTTDDEERQRTGAAGGTEFKLEKRDLYKERKELEAQNRTLR